MCSFATIYGLAKMSGGNFRLGLSNDQYLFLSEIFPYFEENAKVPSMSFYPDFIQIYLNFIQIYLNFIHILSKFYPDLSKFYQECILTFEKVWIKTV
jgi:hypothetical protein